MCGEHFSCLSIFDISLGSSPHVRGAPALDVPVVGDGGIIPACAGSTPKSLTSILTSRDHPRMCGEHAIRDTSSVPRVGSSPHVRGALEQLHGHGAVRGIIPACAGSTRLKNRSPVSLRDHPRMCGEHLVIDGAAPTETGSSPHVRGAHFENSIIPRKRKDNWLFFIQFRFENFLAFRYLLALLHPFLGVPTKDPSFASLGRLINCNPSQSTGDQSAPYTLKAICCSFLAE